MNLIKIFILILVFTIFSNTEAMAQNLTKKSPKIGLVLSGGGAKGLAHIGVLKVIDSLGLKIDYIGGTSMGAIIGGLYASGYTAHQLDSLFQRTEFEKLLSNYTPRSSISKWERFQADRYFIQIPFDNFKVKLPSALSNGQNIYNLFSQLNLPLSHIRDFSKLPIPFFCIATNVETGKEVILDKGNLPLALKASGAIPSLFQPVLRNGELLVDGGVVNNYPIEIMKTKGVDIILGIDVQDGYKDKSELKSAIQILLQISNMRTLNNMVAKKDSTHVYIKPLVEEYHILSFQNGKAIIESGLKEARKSIPMLQDLMKKQSSPIQRKGRKIIDSLVINQIELHGLKRFSRSYVLGKLKLRVNQKKISYQKLLNGFQNLMSTQNFESIYYDFKQPENSNYYSLQLHLVESEWKNSLKASIHYDQIYETGVLLNYTHKNLLFNNDNLSLDFIVGDHLRYNFDYFIDRGFYVSFGISSYYNTFEKNVSQTSVFLNDNLPFTNINKLHVNYDAFNTKVYLQTLFRKDFSLTLGGEAKRLKITSENVISSSNEPFKTENSIYYSLFGNLNFDTYSDTFFPRTGFYFDGNFHWYLSKSSSIGLAFMPFAIGEATIGMSIPLSPKSSINIETQGGFNINGDNSPTLHFALGGYAQNLPKNFINFYGYDFFEISADSFVMAKLDWDYHFINKHHLKLGINVGNIENNLFDNGDWISGIDHSGAALGYGYESFLGPIEVVYTYAQGQPKGYWYFNVGFWF